MRIPSELVERTGERRRREERKKQKGREIGAITEKEKRKKREKGNGKVVTNKKEDGNKNKEKREKERQSSQCLLCVEWSVEGKYSELFHCCKDWKEEKESKIGKLKDVKFTFPS